MPNRDIKDSWKSSKSLDAVSAEAERLFARLILSADDFGRFPADPDLLLAACFPRKVSRWKAQRLLPWYDELEREEMISSYLVNGEPYCQLVNFRKHQGAPRAKKSKYPAPSEGTRIALCAHLRANDRRCGQMRAHVPDLRSSVLRSSIPDLRSAPATPAALEPPAEKPDLPEPRPQGDSEKSVQPETLKTPDPITVSVPAITEPPPDQRTPIRQMIASLSAGAKMENKIGPGEHKRRLRLADRQRSRSP